ncbi:hypothetical protein C942_03287 [Photobacterium marinum]|uniref:Uncharacterized protein n=1 Tax=Photobacterium marinum TaxID=1056511 RepID=L8J6M1_9GAMM|nr:hypothetical protein C942_03287 [Photobacterium marinum]
MTGIIIASLNRDAKHYTAIECHSFMSSKYVYTDKNIKQG